MRFVHQLKKEMIDVLKNQLFQHEEELEQQVNLLLLLIEFQDFLK
jgi:hypothetical protein